MIILKIKKYFYIKAFINPKIKVFILKFDLISLKFELLYHI